MTGWVSPCDFLHAFNNTHQPHTSPSKARGVEAQMVRPVLECFLLRSLFLRPDRSKALPLGDLFMGLEAQKRRKVFLSIPPLFFFSPFCGELKTIDGRRESFARFFVGVFCRRIKMKMDWTGTIHRALVAIVSFFCSTLPH